MFVLGRLLSRLIDVLSVAGLAAVGLMMFHITFDVIGKYVANAPLPATLEIVANYYMVAIVFLPLGLVEKRDAHISVEVITQHFGGGTQKWVTLLTWLLSGAFFVILTYQTWLDAMDKYGAGSYIMGGSLQVAVWPTYFLLPFGCGIMLLVLAYKIALFATGAKSGLGEETGAHRPISE